MPAKNKSLAKRRRPDRADDTKHQGNTSVPQESRAAEAMTVGWMTTAFATIVAELLCGGCWLLVWLVDDSADERGRGFAILATLIAAVTATTSLILTPVVHRVRKVPPPRPIVYGVLLLSSLPWLAIVVAFLVQRAGLGG